MLFLLLALLIDPPSRSLVMINGLPPLLPTSLTSLSLLKSSRPPSSSIHHSPNLVALARPLSWTSPLTLLIQFHLSTALVLPLRCPLPMEMATTMTFPILMTVTTVKATMMAIVLTALRLCSANLHLLSHVRLSLSSSFYCPLVLTFISP